MSNSEQFVRGLSHEAVEAFKNYIPSQRWLQKLIERKNASGKKHTTFFAIRNDYINIYGYGGSLVKLSYKDGSIIGETHFKYLLRKEMQGENDYVVIKNGKPVFKFDNTPLANMFVDSLNDGGLLLDQAKLHAGVEKIGVHELIMCNPNVLDTEITFSKDSDEGEGRKRTDKVDFCAVRKGDDGEVKIVFYEAKHISNPELKGDVIDQLQRYRKQLQERQDEIRDSYRLVCNNIIELCNSTEIDIPFLEYAKMVSNAQRITVDTEPRLVIFGFDEDQKKGILEKIKVTLITDGLVEGSHILCRGVPGGKSWSGVKFDAKDELGRE